ncbi:MAG: hypothetical protein AAF383_10230 [Cyanobacteria bacterium P01_A01_bin.83]
MASKVFCPPILSTRLSYLIVGTLDKSGYLWASILVGQPGFITSSGDCGCGCGCDSKSSDSASPGHRTLQVAAKPLVEDPLANNLALGIDIGLLGIELGKRRRNRLNGSISVNLV